MPKTSDDAFGNDKSIITAHMYIKVVYFISFLVCICFFFIVCHTDFHLMWLYFPYLSTWHITV